MIFNATAKVTQIPNKVDDASKLLIQAVKMMCENNPTLKEELFAALETQDVKAS